MLSALAKRKFWFAAGLGFLVGLFFAFSILIYFLLSHKSPMRINLVLLGESGPGYAGADLTDTIIFASLGKEGTILVSLPRDLWYQPWQTKLNSLYYYGKQKGDGLGQTKAVVGEIVGQKIDFALLVDFAVFQDLVDLVGGVDIMVERTFDDFKYPLAGKENDPCNGDPGFRCRYEHLRFEAGPAHLNGEQALKFVRSRYAEGEEGTDTARSARQQKVIMALKEKMTSPAVFLSPAKIMGLKLILEKRIRSDLTQKDLISLGRIFLSSKARNFQSFVFNDWQGRGTLIYHPQKHPSGQWVLLSKDPTWGQIHKFIECLISQVDKSSCFRQ